MLKPAEFKMGALAVNPAEVVAGFSTVVTIDVSNIGEIKGDYSVTLKVNDKAIDTKSLTIAAGATEKVSFTITQEEGGTYNLWVNGVTGTLKVKEGVLPTNGDMRDM